MLTVRLPSGKVGKVNVRRIKPVHRLRTDLTGKELPVARRTFMTQNETNEDDMDKDDYSSDDPAQMFVNEKKRVKVVNYESPEEEKKKPTLPTEGMITRGMMRRCSVQNVENVPIEDDDSSTESEKAEIAALEPLVREFSELNSEFQREMTQNPVEEVWELKKDDSGVLTKMLRLVRTQIMKKVAK